nr:unnamed protein product [Spirometra erinaceieuropaei]
MAQLIGSPRLSLPTFPSMTKSAAMKCVGGLLGTKIDFKIPLLFSTLFTSLGIVLSHLSVKGTPIFFVITHGVICGIGIGLSYTVTIWVILKWYQSNPHLATGALLCGTGLGSILFSQIQNNIVKPMQCLKDSGTLSECPTILKVPSVFVIIGSIGFTIQLLGISLMRRKKEEFSAVELDSTEEGYVATKLPKNEVAPLTMLRSADFYVLWLYQFAMCFLTFFAVSSYKMFGMLYIEDKFIVHRISESAVAFLIAGYAFWSLLTSQLSYKFSQLLMLIVWGSSIATLPTLMATDKSEVFYAIAIFILHICLAGQVVFTLTATFKLFGTNFFAINLALITSAEVPGGIIFDILATELQLNKHMYGGLYVAVAVIGCVSDD